MIPGKATSRSTLLRKSLSCLVQMLQRWWPRPPAPFSSGEGGESPACCGGGAAAAAFGLELKRSPNIKQSISSQRPPRMRTATRDPCAMCAPQKPLFPQNDQLVLLLSSLTLEERGGQLSSNNTGSYYSVHPPCAHSRATK